MCTHYIYYIYIIYILYIYYIYIIYVYIYLRIRDVDVCVSNNVRFCWRCFTFFWQTTQGEISKNQWEPGLPGRPSRVSIGSCVLNIYIYIIF